MKGVSRKQIWYRIFVQNELCLNACSHALFVSLHGRIWHDLNPANEAAYYMPQPQGHRQLVCAPCSSLYHNMRSGFWMGMVMFIVFASGLELR